MVSCDQWAPLLSGFIDKELTSTERNEVEAHLKVCSFCSAQVMAEEGVKKIIRQSAQIEPIPVHLRAQIRRSISKQTHRISSAGFLESILDVMRTYKAKSAMAMLVLFLVSSLPYFAGHMLLFETGSSGTEGSNVKFEQVTLIGKIICTDCALQVRAGYSKQCKEFHYSGLENDKDGSLWRFIDAGEGIDLIHNLELRGQRIRLSGRGVNGGLVNDVEVSAYQKL